MGQVSSPSYAALWVKSNFSFLEGASHPEELVAHAHARGLAALALTDRDGVYGSVRAHVTALPLGLPLLHGAQISVGEPDELLGLGEYALPILVRGNPAGEKIREIHGAPSVIRFEGERFKLRQARAHPALVSRRIHRKPDTLLARCVGSPAFDQRYLIPHLKGP